MKEENTNWFQSVTAVVIKENKVLLARHTYGRGKGKLIVPGGYVNFNETPQEAVIREYYEETNIRIEPHEVIGIRFNQKDWYVAFSADYISGEACSDHDENSEVLWIDVKDALTREDVPDLTKELIRSAINSERGLGHTDYQGSVKSAPYSLYCK